MLTLIVACAKDRAIGKDNTIPWFAPEDLALFKRETLGGAVIMGRNTWDSLPKKPLPSRDNIVVSSKMEGETVVSSFDQAVQLAHQMGHMRLYAMGGAAIYQEALAQADRLLITEVDLVVEGADTFFPAFSPEEWQLVHSQEIRAQSPRCVITEYLRKSR